MAKMSKGTNRGNAGETGTNQYLKKGGKVGKMMYGGKPAMKKGGMTKSKKK